MILKGGIFMNSHSKYPLIKKTSSHKKREEQCNCKALVKKMIYELNYGNLGPVNIIFTANISTQTLNQPIASITIDTSCLDCPDIIIDFNGILNVTPIISANSTLTFTLYRVCSNVINRQEVATFSFNVADTFGGVTASHTVSFRSFTKKNECNDCCTYVLELTSIANIDLGPITYAINGTISALAIESC